MLFNGIHEYILGCNKVIVYSYQRLSSSSGYQVDRLTGLIGNDGLRWLVVRFSVGLNIMRIVGTTQASHIRWKVLRSIFNPSSWVI